ncbi:MAG: YggT family protein [Ilumatobacteraceae bacterium]
MIVGLLCTATEIFSLLILARVLLSWFPINPYGPMGQILRWVHMVTEPVLAPVRRSLPAFGPLDLSPLVVLLFLNIVVQRLILGC